jgi:hypothetical protein
VSWLWRLLWERGHTESEALKIEGSTGLSPCSLLCQAVS